jgi:hypothetical protein
LNFHEKLYALKSELNIEIPHWSNIPSAVQVYTHCRLYREQYWALHLPRPVPVSSTNKTDRYDITEILLEVALKTHNPNTI